ncbi:MAG: SGNH/GDSL hydrolase family protein [bacterium]|nr:SGNH/GDSL hydrolase family protein [bacterium]
MLPNINRIKNGLKFVKLLLKKRLRRLTGKQVIEVIGDSHTLLFQSEYFNINYIGPATAYNLGSTNSTNKSRDQVLRVIEEGQKHGSKYFLFVLGEIDARIHIYNQHKKKNLPIDECISFAITRYLEFLGEIQKKNPVIQIIICNIFPPGEQDNVYKYEYYADRNTRMDITRRMNNEIENQIEEKAFIYINVYSALLDDRGERISKYIFDDIHYNCDILPLIEAEIKKNIPEI